MGVCVGHDGDRPRERPEAAHRHLHIVATDGERDERRRRSARQTIYRHDGAGLVGAHDERPRLRLDARPARHGLLRDDVDGDRRRLVALPPHEQLVVAGRQLEVARHGARGRGVLAVDMDGSPGCVGAQDADGADDAREPELYRGGPPGLHRRRCGDGVLEAGGLGDDPVGPAREAERLGRGSPLSEVLAVDVDRRAGRVGHDLQDGHVRLHPPHRLLDARARGGVGLPLQGAGVRAVRLGVLVQRVVAAGDVEQHVAVRRQAVGQQEVLQRAPVVPSLVSLGGDPEVKVGLVGDVVGAGDGCDSHDAGRREEDERHAHSEPAEATYGGEEAGAHAGFSVDRGVSGCTRVRPRRERRLLGRPGGQGLLARGAALARVVSRGVGAAHRRDEDGVGPPVAGATRHTGAQSRDASAVSTKATETLRPKQPASGTNGAATKTCDSGASSQPTAARASATAARDPRATAGHCLRAGESTRRGAQARTPSSTAPAYRVSRMSSSPAGEGAPGGRAADFPP